MMRIDPELYKYEVLSAISLEDLALTVLSGGFLALRSSCTGTYKMPAEPTPATARPMMSAVEVGAAPHTADPISKMIRHAR